MDDPGRIVETGYDVIAETYLGHRLDLLTDEEQGFLDRVVEAIRPGSRVLELGCGPGVPFTATLAARARVVAIDRSAGQLRLAREQAPGARYVRADMTRFEVRPSSVDAVVAFASFGHVPLELHEDLLGSIATWLRPGGLFASQHPTGDNPFQLEDDWMGAPMYFSHPDLETTLGYLRARGFVIEALDEVRGREVDGSVGHWAGLMARLPG